MVCLLVAWNVSCSGSVLHSRPRRRFNRSTSSNNSADVSLLWLSSPPLLYRRRLGRWKPCIISSHGDHLDSVCLRWKAHVRASMCVRVHVQVGRRKVGEVRARSWDGANHLALVPERKWVTLWPHQEGDHHCHRCLVCRYLPLSLCLWSRHMLCPKSHTCVRRHDIFGLHVGIRLTLTTLVFLLSSTPTSSIKLNYISKFNL